MTVIKRRPRPSDAVIVAALIDDDTLIDAREVSAMTDLKVGTIRDWPYRNDRPHPIKLEPGTNGAIRWKRQDVLDYLAEVEARCKHRSLSECKAKHLSGDTK
jgi:predicted DNA-binding transcriptional regulator AlpA